jgi:DNA-directed RNA polymerase subunit alpha
MLKFRNFGRKSLQELIQVLEERGLHFGMEVDKYMEEV